MGSSKEVKKNGKKKGKKVGNIVGIEREIGDEEGRY
jgi:hypothetical protein